LAKEPLVQFFLIGACIYGAYALYGAPGEEVSDKTILVDAGRIESFIGEWERRWKRPPTRQELDGVIGAFVREDILYRQAVAMGLGEDDPITRRRLAQKLEFLTNDIALFREPVEGELQQYFQDNQELYREPGLITFSQVFLDPDKRDAATLADARELLARLKSAGDPDGATLDAGDSFMLQSYYREVSESDIRRQLGSGFSEAVMQLAPGRWHGPVLSACTWSTFTSAGKRRHRCSTMSGNMCCRTGKESSRNCSTLSFMKASRAATKLLLLNHRRIGSSMARRIRKSKRDPMPGKSPRHDTRRVQTWAEVGCVRPARPVHQPDCRFGR
jgi:hypothetical protein